MEKDREYCVELPRAFYCYIGEGINNCRFCVVSDVLAMRNKMQDVIDQLTEVNEVSACECSPEDACALFQRAKSAEAELAAERLKSANARAKALREAADAMWTLGPDICRSDASNAILELFETSGGVRK